MTSVPNQTRRLQQGRHHDGDLIDRETPRDEFAEKAVVASVFLAPSLMKYVAKDLRSQDFFDEATRTIFEAMLDLHHRGIPADVVLTSGALRDSGKWNIDGGVHAGTLCDLYYLVPTAVHCDFYMERVLSVSRRRQAFYRGLSLLGATRQSNPPAVRRHVPWGRA